jgi:hypothetical protein
MSTPFRIQFDCRGLLDLDEHDVAALHAAADEIENLLQQGQTEGTIRIRHGSQPVRWTATVEIPPPTRH